MKNIAVEEAMVFLLNVCDGARAHDRVGFSGVDARFMHSIGAFYERTGRLTVGQRAAALRIMKKYAGQLAKSDLACDPSLPPPVVEKPAKPKKASRIMVFEHVMFVTFEYDPALVEQMRKLRGRVAMRFEKYPEPRWVIEYTKMDIYFAVVETLLPLGFEIVDA